MNISSTKSWSVYSTRTPAIEYFVEEHDGLDRQFEQRLLEKYKSEVVDYLKNKKTVVRLQNEIIEAKLFNLKQLNVPMMLDDAPTGYDGTTYELEIGTGGTHLKLHWWDKGPSRWKPIIEWYDDMVEYLSSITEAKKNR